MTSRKMKTMTNTKSLILAILVGLLSAGNSSAQGAGSFDELVTLRDSAKIIEAPIFAPKVWEKAQKKFVDAEKSIRLGKKQKTIDKYVAESREYTDNAVKATGQARHILEVYLPPRDKAREAKAVILVPELYQKAEIQFTKATAKVESGDVKGALKEAEKSSSLFDYAEVEAIRVDILGEADRLIAKADVDDASKFALATLDRAKSAREKANSLITADRYDREFAIAEAARAEYEARHASNIGLSVRSLKRNDQAWEKLMLEYEIQMNRVGEAIGLDHLPFDQGSLAAADTLINYIRALQGEKVELSGQMSTLSTDVTRQIEALMEMVGIPASGGTPVEMARVVGDKIAELQAENQTLSERLEVSQADLADLSLQHEEVAGELSGRVEKEEKFRTAKTMLNPSEGEVLFNSSNDIVLRLSGLSFNVGKSDIQDDHIPLLEKVKQVVELFPGSQLVVEGHTDASGDGAANVTLSEKRAFSVMQYLRQSLLIPANQIQSMGYGADRPVASNQTSEGRAKNRRIDVIIMR